jgi:hypothetical protein
MSTVNGGWRGPNIVKDGLLLYLDAGSPNSFYSATAGTTWKDISGNGYNGTLTNGPTFDGANGGSIVLDGVDDYINFTSQNPIISNNPFTLSTWLNVKTHSTYGISLYIGTAQTGQSAYLGFVAEAQTGTANSIGGGFYGVNIGSGVLPNTGWHFVSLTYNGSSASIYVDGIIRATRNSYTANLSSVSIRIGRANSGTLYSFNGNVSTSLIYNRALSSSEILQNFNATRARFSI